MREDASRLLEPTTGRLLVRVQSGEHGHAGQRLRGKVREAAWGTLTAFGVPASAEPAAPRSRLAPPSGSSVAAGQLDQRDRQWLLERQPGAEVASSRPQPE